MTANTSTNSVLTPSDVYDRQGHCLGEMQLPLNIGHVFEMADTRYRIVDWQQEFFPHADSNACVIVEPV